MTCLSLSVARIYLPVLCIQLPVAYLWLPVTCLQRSVLAWAVQVGARLRREISGPHRVVCSPYLRCVETAAEIVKALMASDSEVAHRAAAAAAKAGPAPGAPVGAGIHSQAVNQMMVRSCCMPHAHVYP